MADFNFENDLRKELKKFHLHWDLRLQNIRTLTKC